MESKAWKNRKDLEQALRGTSQGCVKFYQAVLADKL